MADRQCDDTRQGDACRTAVTSSEVCNEAQFQTQSGATVGLQVGENCLQHWQNAVRSTDINGTNSNVSNLILTIRMVEIS
jgi:hypothetical protein